MLTLKCCNFVNNYVSDFLNLNVFLYFLSTQQMHPKCCVFQFWESSLIINYSFILRSQELHVFGSVASRQDAHLALNAFRKKPDSALIISGDSLEVCLQVSYMLMGAGKESLIRTNVKVLVEDYKIYCTTRCELIGWGGYYTRQVKGFLFVHAHSFEKVMSEPQTTPKNFPGI